MNELLIAVIFYSIIGLIIFYYRKRFEWIQGIILAYRSKKPLKWMDKLKPSHWFWKVYSTILIPLDFAFMPIIIYSLGSQAFNILISPSASAGVAIALPGVRIPGSPIYIPLFYGVISIAILAFVHEMAHGIIGKSEGVKLKSAGFGMFLIFPLFFVEPDEKSLNKASKLSRLRMIGAGAGSNITLSFIIVLITSLTLAPFFQANSMTNGVKITSVMPDYPASTHNMSADEIITSINNHSINNLTTFSSIINQFKPNDLINITTNKAAYTLSLAANPKNDSLPYLGVYISDNVIYTSEAINKYGLAKLNFLRIILELLYWISFLNFSIGVMNLMPIIGLDGYQMLKDLLSLMLNNKQARIITNIISSISIGLLLINLSPLIFSLFK